MLGRAVADRLATSSPESLFAPEIVEIANEADLFVKAGRPTSPGHWLNGEGFRRWIEAARSAWPGRTA
jgi:hypothetical protein